MVVGKGFVIKCVIRINIGYIVKVVNGHVVSPGVVSFSACAEEMP